MNNINIQDDTQKKEHLTEVDRPIEENLDGKIDDLLSRIIHNQYLKNSNRIESEITFLEHCVNKNPQYSKEDKKYYLNRLDNAKELL